jgi:tetratricopeptide (TPR) repeat protein
VRFAAEAVFAFVMVFQTNFNDLGNQATQRGDFTEALADYTHAIEQSPELPEPLYNRALTYSRLHRDREALNDALASIRVAPLFADGFALSARLYRDAGNLDAADRSIERARLLKPDRTAYRVLAAEIRERENRIADAATLLATVIAMDPSDSDSTYNLARLRIDQHRATEALPLLQRYVQLVPNSSDVTTLVAEIFLNANRPIDALDWLDHHPTKNESAVDDRARALLMLGKKEAAAALLAENSTIVTPYRERVRGDLELRAGDCSAAEMHYAAASANLKPSTAATRDEHFFFWRNFAVANICANHARQAITALDNALAIEPSDALALRYRADARRTSGDILGAIGDATQALALDPTNATLLMMLGVDEYRVGNHTQGRAHYKHGCALLAISETASRQTCALQLSKMR